MIGKKICKKIWGILFALVLMVCYLCMPVEYVGAVDGEATENKVSAQAAEVKLSKAKATVIMGNTLTLTVKNLDSSKVSTIKWKANRTSIAKVSQKGVVTPVKAGTTTIKCTITYKDKTEQILSCTVTVKNRKKATDVTIINENVSLQVGESLVLKAELSPAKTTDQVYWFSSNKAVATVGVTSGKVTAKKSGTVVITAKVGQNKQDATAETNKVVTEIKIKVKSKEESKTVIDESYFVWEENKSGLTITDYKKEGLLKKDLPKDIVIPEKINGVTVTQIGYAAFASCGSLNSVTIPKSVIKIGDSAFYGCSNLEEITIPEGVLEIEKYAFHWCSSLNSITIPKSITMIGDGTFEGCRALKEITIPEGVTEINRATFRWCYNLNSVTIPKSVLEIGAFAFSGCSSLDSVTIPENVTLIAWNAFENCESLNSVTIPKSVTEIDSGAFEGCSSLKELVIPDSVTEIGSGVFDGCSSLEKITISEGVTEITGYMFRGCGSLNSITIPKNVTKIGRSAFESCSSLKKVIIPEGVWKIETKAFWGCSSLNSVIIPKSVIQIEDNVFSNVENLEIHGEKGSYAQEYAQKNGFKFVEK